MLKILYAEDNLSERKLIARILEMSDFEVLVVDDGLEAMEQAEAWQPDLILMDIGLPKVDGLQATKMLREKESTRRVPIIAVTAWDHHKYRARAEAAGVDDYLTKPIERDQLLTSIRKHLKGVPQ